MAADEQWDPLGVLGRGTPSAKDERWDPLGAGPIRTEPGYLEAAKYYGKAGLESALSAAEAAGSLISRPFGIPRTFIGGEEGLVSKARKYLQPTEEEQGRAAEFTIPQKIVGGLAAVPGGALRYGPLAAMGPWGIPAAGAIGMEEARLEGAPVSEQLKRGAIEAGTMGVFGALGRPAITPAMRAARQIPLAPAEKLLGRQIGRVGRAGIGAATFAAPELIEGQPKEAIPGAVTGAVLFGLHGKTRPYPPPTPPPEQWQGPTGFWRRGREPGAMPIPYRARRAWPGEGPWFGRMGEEGEAESIRMYQDENGVWRVLRTGPPAVPPVPPEPPTQGPPPPQGPFGGPYEPPRFFRGGPPPPAGTETGPGIWRQNPKTGAWEWDTGVEPAAGEPYVSPDWVREGRTQPPPEWPPVPYEGKPTLPKPPPAPAPGEFQGPPPPPPPPPPRIPSLQNDRLDILIAEAQGRGGGISKGFIGSTLKLGTRKSEQILQELQDAGLIAAPTGGLGEAQRKKWPFVLTDKVDKPGTKLRYYGELMDVRQEISEMAEAGLKKAVETKVYGQEERVTWKSTFPPWAAMKGWGKDEIVAAIDKGIGGNRFKGEPKQEAIWNAAKAEARARFRARIQEMRLEKRRQLREQLDDANKPDPLDELTGAIDDEIMGFRYELEEEGWEPEVVERAVAEVRAAAARGEIPPDYEGIKRSLSTVLTELDAADEKAIALSPVRPRQPKLPGQTIGIPFPQQALPGGFAPKGGPTFPPTQLNLFGRVPVQGELFGGGPGRALTPMGEKALAGPLAPEDEQAIIAMLDQAVEDSAAEKALIAQARDLTRVYNFYRRRKPTPEMMLEKNPLDKAYMDGLLVPFRTPGKYTDRKSPEFAAFLAGVDSMKESAQSLGVEMAVTRMLYPPGPPKTFNGNPIETLGGELLYIEDTPPAPGTMRYYTGGPGDGRWYTPNKEVAYEAHITEDRDGPFYYMDIPVDDLPKYSIFNFPERIGPMETENVMGDIIIPKEMVGSGIRLEAKAAPPSPPPAGPAPTGPAPSPELSPIAKGQYKLPGMKIGVEFGAKGEAPEGGEKPPLFAAAEKAAAKKAQPELPIEEKAPELKAPELPIVRVVDSRDPKWQDQNLGNAGYVTGDIIEAVHVTDDPKPVLNTLKKNLPIVGGRREGTYGELGRGLYASGVPQYWMGRSTGKYEFLKRLTPEELEKLLVAIENHPNMTEPNYLAQFEKDRLIRDVGYVREKKLSPDILVQFADQPFNIRFWEPEFLKNLGIKPSKQPQEVPVILQGKFVELSRSITEEQAEELRKQGFDGAFLRGGMTTSPQIVVWNNEAITKFGDWMRKMEVRPAFEAGDIVEYKGEFWEVGFVNKEGQPWAGTLRLQKSAEAGAKQVNKVDPAEVKLVQAPKEIEVTEADRKQLAENQAFSKAAIKNYKERIQRGEYVPPEAFDYYPEIRELIPGVSYLGPNMAYDPENPLTGKYVVNVKTPDGEMTTAYLNDLSTKALKAKVQEVSEKFKPEKAEKKVAQKRFKDIGDWSAARNAELAEAEKMSDPQARLDKINEIEARYDKVKRKGWITTKAYPAKLKLEAEAEIANAVPKPVRPFTENGLIRTTIVDGEPIYGGGPGTHAGDVMGKFGQVPEGANIETGYTIVSEWDPADPHKGFLTNEEAAKWQEQKLQDEQPAEPTVKQEAEAAKEEKEAPPKVGRVYVRKKGREQWRTFVDAEEITRGKNKGKVRVTLTNGEKIIVDKDDIKMQGEGGGPAEFRTGEPPEEPLTREAVDGFAREKLKAYKNAPEIEILDFADIPDRLIQGLRENLRKGIKGIYDPLNKKIYLIRDMLGSESDVLTTIEHEAVGHFGMEAILGKESDPFFNRVWMKYGRKGLGALAEERGYDLGTQAGRLKAAREYVARMAETGKEPGLLKQVYGWIREQLRKIFPGKKITDAEIQNMIKRSRDFLRSDSEVKWQGAQENLKAHIRGVATEPMFSIRQTMKDMGKIGYEQEVKPKWEGMKKGWQWLKHALAPTIGVDVRDLNTFSRMLGDREMYLARVEFRTAQAAKELSKLSRDEQIEFIDRIQRGDLQSLPPNLRAIADLHRQIEDELWSMANIILGHMDEPERIQYLENHVRTFWKKIPTNALDEITRKGFSGLWRRPLEGTRAPLFHQYWTLKEGMANGGEPFTTNLMEMTRLNFEDTMKLVTARRMWDSLLETGHRVFIKWSERMPEGFVPIEDRIANRYFPKTPEKIRIMTPEGPKMMTAYEAELRRTALSDPDPAKRGEAADLLTRFDQGWRPKEWGAGRWVVEENAARLLTNYLGRDRVRENPLLNGLMAIKNVTTAFELGFSAFHAVFETFEAMASQMGLGMRMVWNQKKVAEGMKEMFGAPLAPYTQAKIGAQVLRYFKDPQAFATSTYGQKFLQQFPDAAEAMTHLFWGGGSVRMNQAYKISSLNVFKENINSKNYIGAAQRSIPALSQWVMTPLFERYIPALKRGVFFKEFSNEVMARQADILAGKVTKAEIARDVWHFVENRFGEMNFDNLWWNRTMKSGLQLAIRSVTWKLGNIRSYGEAITGQSSELLSAMKERRRPMLGQEMAWVWGLGIITAAIASITQYAFTGKNPETWKDLVYPQIDNQGGRISLPTYMRDLFHIGKHPVKYVTSSLAGWYGRFIDVLNNKDFYGVQVHDPNEAKLFQIMDDTVHMIPLPFSFTSFKRMKEEGETPFKQALGFLGGTKAPYWIERTDAEMKASELKAGHLPVAGRTPADFERGRRLKMYARQFQEAQLKGEDTSGIMDQFNSDIQEGKLYHSDTLRFRERIRYEPLVSSVQHLPFRDVLEVWKVSTDEEKAKLYPILMKKYGGLRNVEDRALYFPKIQEVKAQYRPSY